ncbi:DB module [Trichostrongylus colubriformis]|uniref:DB module n=1 Tax=Trichostrongylus colubriformis TaxID=6319 RepID=A0AAN8FSH3_TRICO
MKTLWVLVALLGTSIADLPSCERARCSHCEVIFIAKMCQKTCDACPKTITGTNEVKYYQQDNRLPLGNYQQGNKELYEGIKLQNSVRKSPLGVSAPKQAGVTTETLSQAPREVRFQQPYHNVQLAAPQTQVPLIQYPQQQQQQYTTGVSTLAPLLPALRPTDINTQLAQRPADLAQPLSEYNNNGAQGGFPSLQQFQIPAPVQTPYYNTNQNPYSQPTATFAQPAAYQQQAAQPSQTSTLQYPPQPAASPLMSLFQPPIQQTGTGSTTSLLDPLGLFNFGAMSQLGQPVSTTPFPFAPLQPGFGVTPVTSQQSLQPAQGSFFGQPQQLQYDQQYQGNYNQQTHPNMQSYPGQQQQQQQQQQQPHIPAAGQQQYQNVYGQQNTNYNLPQQQRVPQQANQQQAQTYRVNQPQAQQPRYQQQPLNPLPRTPISSSIDAAPINVHKYVDGKGAVPAVPPHQCPRQPGWLPCITKQQANERFNSCCARLGDGCTPLCNYDAPLATVCNYSSR